MAKRIAAWIAVLLIAACVIATLILAITGSEYFFGMLMITIMVPIFLWIYLYMYKLLKDKSK